MRWGYQFEQEFDDLDDAYVFIDNVNANYEGQIKKVVISNYGSK